MRGIILAAGMGQRLGRGLPKALTQVGSRTILEYQIEAFTAQGVNEIAIVTGYKDYLFKDLGFITFHNPEYQHSNMLRSLSYAFDWMTQPTLISYSDIVFSSSIIQQLKKNQSAITIGVDPHWWPRYSGRDHHPMTQAELVEVQDSGLVTSFGKRSLVKQPEVFAEFIGVFKVNEAGTNLLKKAYSALSQGAGQSRAQIYKWDNAYLTELFQHVVDTGGEVCASAVNGRWIEIDTLQDLEYAEESLKKNPLF
ncbi:phosphocholine cytidylyltransferase family protein [Actinomycetota bacterium]|nr:phosphocholine cytidylyltransferase family protein [Actinomycetota bacterium]